MSTIKGIEFVGVSAYAEQELRHRLAINDGDSFSPAEIQRISGIVREFDSHLSVGMRHRKPAADGPVETTLTISVPPGMQGQVTSPSATDASHFPPAEPGVGRIRVGGNVQSTKLIKKITPSYPPLAKQARIQGTVRFNALIDKDGNLKNLELVSGHPLLVDSASTAVKQWVYETTLLNGQPVEVVTVIDVNYTLSE